MVAQELDLGNHELTFVDADHKSVLFKALEHRFEMLEVLRLVGTSDKQVVHVNETVIQTM